MVALRRIELKELKRRHDARRILIVAPAGLVLQWQRELLTKFGEDFTVVSRDYMDEHNLDTLDVWRETNFAITSVYPETYIHPGCIAATADLG